MMWRALCRHWPEFLMEAAGLGFFMVLAGLFGTLLEYPNSPAHQALPDPLIRRVLMGLAMGITAVAIIYSPWGKQSGAHINPAVTVTFWRLGKIAGWDATFYILFQFFGGLVGVCLVIGFLGESFTLPPVAGVATVPGSHGPAVAFVAEFATAFITMTTVLLISNTPRFARFTGIGVGMLIVVYITVEAPLSGFSQNPARTFASAWPTNTWTGIWIYFFAPFGAMLAAAEVYVAMRGGAAVACAKLHHQNGRRCIFCEYQHAITVAADKQYDSQLGSSLVRKEVL